MSLLNTNLFSLTNQSEDEVKQILKSVAASLSKENYDPVEQIVGYLLTGEPIYITAKHNARNKMRKLERSKVLQQIVRAYLK